MEVEVFPERMDGHDDAGDTTGQTQSGLHEFKQALVGDAAEVLE